MAEPFAQVQDLRTHWPGLPAESDSEASQKLIEASIEIRGLYPDVDMRISAGSLDPDVPKLIVCRMVKRALAVDDDAPAAGMESFTFGAGPFSMGGKVHNADGAVYLSAADKRLLNKPRSSRRAWTIIPGG